VVAGFTQEPLKPLTNLREMRESRSRVRSAQIYLTRRKMARSHSACGPQEPLLLVVVAGFVQEPLLPLTNLREMRHPQSPWYIAQIYLTRRKMAQNHSACGPQEPLLLVVVAGFTQEPLLPLTNLRGVRDSRSRGRSAQI